MTRKTTRMLTALLSCSMAVTNVVPFHVMAETAPGDPQEEQVPSTKNQEQDTKETAPVSLTNFKGDHVRSEGGKVMLDNTGGDNFAMSEDSKVIADDFHYSADLTIKSGDAQCAALLVGVGDRNDPSKAWRAANVIRHEGENKMRMFRVPGDHNYQPMQVLNDYDSTKTVHLDLDIKANGDFTYKVTSEGGSENVMSGNMDDWAGGYIGVLTFQTEAELSNIQFTDRTVRADDSLFHTTLENLRGLQGSWKITEKGMHSQGSGDNFAISDTKIENFEYSANINNLDKKGAGGTDVPCTESR